MYIHISSHKVDEISIKVYSKLTIVRVYIHVFLSYLILYTIVPVCCVLELKLNSNF